MQITRPRLRLGESNFDILTDYPEFPDFNYIPPIKPIFLDDSFSVNSYRREVADFIATINDYAEDGRHYIRNCQNDYNTIFSKGEELRNYIKTLAGENQETTVSPDPNRL